MLLEAASVTDTYTGRVDPDAAVAFALATNDRNERYLRGEAVPPLFTAGLILEAHWEAAQRSGIAERVYGARGGVHGQHDMRWWGSIRPGMALQWWARTRGVTQTKGGVLVTQQVVVTGSDGEPLVEHLWSNFFIGGEVDADLGEAPPDHTFPSSARAHPIGVRSVPVDRDQGFRYGGVSGDRVGHAIDDEVARSEGYPRKILQGMCTLGLCSGAVVDAVAGGDPDRLQRLAGRFSAPAFPGQQLVVSLYDAGRTDDGAQVVAWEATQDGAVVIKHGRAEVRP